MQKELKKTKDHAFNKDVYLLGKDADSVKYWLESPKWDCGWYWGFGYVETYKQNRQPSKALDISSHSHADGEYKGTESDKNIFTGDFLTVKTFSEKEGWELRELMTEFYFLRESAQYWNSGNCHISGTGGMIPKDEALAKEINSVIIPKITARIVEILSPIL